MRLFLVYAVIIISLGQCTALDRIDRVLFYCDFDSNICDFRQQANNGYKWLITQKRTYTDRTGPETAHSNGRYVYTEATQGNPGDAITMQTGWMEPRSTNITISFYRHMYGDHVGSLNLYVLVCNGVSSSSRLVWGTSGSSGNVWLRTDVQVVLGESPHRFKLKFEAIRGIGELGDVAIDTLTVKDNPLLEDYCYSGLGIEYGNIPDSALTASSSFGTNFGPEYSRLNSLPLPPNKGGWSAGILDQRQWIQVDLVENYLVIGIAVQARYNSIQWVSSYQVSYRLDVYSVWNYTPVLCGYSANPGKRAVRAHFQDPIKARFIRVHPLKWHSYISLRWEVFGCRD
ncbi:thyroid hormone-induced protein B-like [Antedon mediterranea]|uniref:thyroid hormone-induced protein B-like n=1 Tax=Antedon mediterranea TaxID=105859 RepID=UPI003AF488FF